MTSVSPIASSPATAGTSAGTSAERTRLHQAAQAFEAIFVRQMLSAARASQTGDTLWGNDKGQDTFTAMRDEHFADIAAQSGALGLAKQVEKQLAARLPLTLAGPKG